MKQGFVHVVFSYQTTWCYVKIRNLFRIWHVLEIVSLLLTHVLACNGMYGISKQYHKVTVHFLRGGGGGGALRSCMPLPSVNIFSYLPPPQKKQCFLLGYPPQIIAQPLFTISRHCTMCQPAINFEFVEESKKGKIDFWSSGYGCSQCCFFVIDEWNFFIIDEGKHGIIRFVAFSKDDEIVFIPLIATAFASTVVSLLI